MNTNIVELSDLELVTILENDSKYQTDYVVKVEHELTSRNLDPVTLENFAEIALRNKLSTSLINNLHNHFDDLQLNSRFLSTSQVEELIREELNKYKERMNLLNSDLPRSF